MQNDPQGKEFSPLRLAADCDSSTEKLRRRLAELSERLDKPHIFSKGQFVRWKPGLKNRKVPDYAEPAIVREVLDSPVFDSCEHARCAGSPDFGEPLTLVLATLDADGEFLEFRYDRRRFEPFETQSEAY